MQDPSMICRLLILLTCAVNIACSVTVELYSKQNYSGLLKKITITTEYCLRLDQTYEVRSLKTEKCVMVYETEDCSRIDAPTEGSKLYSVRVESDTAIFDIDYAYRNRKDERGVQSFQLCDNMLGGGLLNIDIYSGPSYTGDLVASYEAVCGCKNIPSYMSNGLKGKPFSMDNHGKNMYFYDKEDCTGHERLIPAGDNERSRSVLRLDNARAVVIRSFRPAGLLCPNLDASVVKFTTSVRLDTEKHVKQKTTYTMTNRQPTPVTEYINVNVSVSVKYSVAKPFTYIHTTRVKAGFVMSSNAGYAGLLEHALKSSLEAHYQHPNTNENTRTITVTKPSPLQAAPVSVDIPPCNTCTVDVTVENLQEFPVRYIAEAIVTGVEGDDKVSAEQIRHFLPSGMKYVKDYDDYSVVVTVEGEMKGSLGTCHSHKSCNPVPDCEPHLKVDL